MRPRECKALRKRALEYVRAHARASEHVRATWRTYACVRDCSHGCVLVSARACARDVRVCRRARAQRHARLGAPRRGGANLFRRSWRRKRRKRRRRAGRR
eukprot:6180973-Pleurochrysis_carterae.AAC.6